MEKVVVIIPLIISGWTVIQRRIDGAVSFNRIWGEYKQGFGHLSGNFWLGNENIHRLCVNAQPKLSELRFDLMKFTNTKYYATYDNSEIEGEADKYRLKLGTYRGKPLHLSCL